MAMAANAGTMAQAKELNEPTTVIKWSTSGGLLAKSVRREMANCTRLDAPQLQQLIHPIAAVYGSFTFKNNPRKARNRHC